MVRVDDRIRLWRNTIQLFHRYKKDNFIGPFYESGYNDYRVEAMLLERSSGKERTPDIIACSSQGWLVVELTNNDKSKEPKLDSYKNCDPRYLRNYGLRTDYSEPDTISSRLSMVDDGHHCQILVDDKLVVIKDDLIVDPVLREALHDANGKSLSRLPEIPVSLVPEMNRGPEIRRGLIDIVLQLFSPECTDGKTDYDMCIEGLERLKDVVPPGSIGPLKEKVKSEMDVLVKKDLEGYLVFKDGKYKATDKFKEHPRAREMITKKLQEWANPSNRTLSDFP